MTTSNANGFPNWAQVDRTHNLIHVPVWPVENPAGPIWFSYLHDDTRSSGAAEVLVFSLESATGCTHDTGLNEWAPHRIIRNSSRVHIWWHPVNNIDIYFYFYCNFNTVYLPHSSGLRPPENMLSPIQWVFLGLFTFFLAILLLLAVCFNLKNNNNSKGKSCSK